MTVSYKPFQTDDGFKSVGFLVDENGNFSIANLNTTSAYKINGYEVLSQTALGNSVLSSQLTSVGTLTGLNTNSTADINLLSATAINLTAPDTQISSTTLTATTTGAIVLLSGTTGSIDNVDIGVNTPGNGTFNTLTANADLFVGSQNIKALSAAFAVALS
jgi:hypothetical protein